MSIMRLLLKDLNQHGDSFYTKKKEFSKKDVSIAPFSDTITIGINTKELVKEFA